MSPASEDIGHLAGSDDYRRAQEATNEILRVISLAATDPQPVFDLIAQSATKLCGAEVCTVTRFDGELVYLDAIFGSNRAGIEALRRTFPMQPSDAGGAARAIHQCAIIQIPDVRADPHYTIQEAALTSGFRAIVAVPMLREGRAIGAITVGRADPGLFSDMQVQLLATFAAQAVIAIENTRLLNELRQRTDDLTEALEQQTATSEVLQIISSSPTDVQPVFEAMVGRAAQLCEAHFSAVARFEDGLLHLVALNNLSPEEMAAFHSLFPRPLARNFVMGRAFVDAQPVHFEDVLAELDYDARTREILQRTLKYRTFMAVPIIREGRPIGVIGCGRREVRPFTATQIGLVKTFADQAVIAIENVRLFDEVQARTRELSEALEQQTATSEVLQVISSSPGELEPVFQAMLENAKRICGAKFGALWQFEDRAARIVSQLGYPPAFAEFLQRGSHRPGPLNPLTRVVETLDIVHIADYRADPSYLDGDPLAVAGVELGGIRTLLVVPMIKEGRLVGAIGIFHQDVRPFTDKQIELVTNFARQAVIAIENTRLLNELRQRTADLSASLDQQMGMSEVLRVISSSPTDLAPVFDIILTNATRLCEGNFSLLCRYDGGVLVGEATCNGTPEFTEKFMGSRFTPGRQGPTRLAALERRTVHVADMTAEPGFSPMVLQYERARTVLAVPLLREANLVGVITIWRREVRPFTEQQIALVQTFADQAAIAIENTRLLTELRESLQQQTATADVLKVISRTTFDLQTVLDALVESAARLCCADRTAIQ